MASRSQPQVLTPSILKLAGHRAPPETGAQKKSPVVPTGTTGLLEKTRQYLLSRKCNIIGSSRFTTVFGMGTGMAKSLWSPGRRAGGRTLRSIEEWPTRLKDGELGNLYCCVR